MLYFCAYLNHEPGFRFGRDPLISTSTASGGGTPQHRLYEIRN